MKCYRLSRSPRRASSCSRSSWRGPCGRSAVLRNAACAIAMAAPTRWAVARAEGARAARARRGAVRRKRWQPISIALRAGSSRAARDVRRALAGRRAAGMRCRPRIASPPPLAGRSPVRPPRLPGARGLCFVGIADFRCALRVRGCRIGKICIFGMRNRRSPRSAARLFDCH